MRYFMLPTSALLFSTGCVPEFATVDEACVDTVRGGSTTSPLGLAVQNRVDCHRRVAGLTRGSFDKLVSAAATAHAEYMHDNNSLSTTETEGVEGFTGGSVWERLEYQQYDTSNVSSNGLYNLYGTVLDGMDAADWVDTILMASYTYREFVLQPGLIDGGWGDSGIRIDYILLHDYPSTQHSNKPIAYPSDGQSEVPVSYYAFDPAIDSWTNYGELMGYPITLVFSGWDTEGSDNVYGINVVDPVLTGPNGEVEIQYTVPGWDQAYVRYSAAIVPLDPLETNATYTLTATVSWLDEKKDIELSFQTRASDEPANAAVLDYVDRDLDDVLQPTAPLGLRRGFVSPL